MRELLKDERSELKLRSLRTPEGRRRCCWYSGDDVVGAGNAEAGEMGVRKLSTRVCFARLCIDDVCAKLSFSGSGVGGNAPGMSLGFVGCEVKGPPPGVGGLPELTGESGGESRGAGISVPAVREYSTGLTESAI